MKPKQSKEKKIKAWAVVKKDGTWTEQVTTQMSPKLIEFYNRSKEYKVVKCTITYIIN